MIEVYPSIIVTKGVEIKVHLLHYRVVREGFRREAEIVFVVVLVDDGLLQERIDRDQDRVRMVMALVELSLVGMVSIGSSVVLVNRRVDSFLDLWFFEVDYLLNIPGMKLLIVMAIEIGGVCREDLKDLVHDVVIDHKEKPCKVHCELLLIQDSIGNLYW